MFKRRLHLMLGSVCGAGLLAALTLFSLTAQAGGILYVAPGGVCGGALPCYATLQAALEAAYDGYEIRMAAGTYPLAAGNDQIARVEKDLTIRGGFTTGNWDTPDPDANLTILDADGRGRVMVITGEAQVTVEGLRMQYGSASGLGGGGGTIDYDAGGALFVDNAGLTLRQTKVMSSTAISGLGGGIYVTGSPGELVIEDCVVRDNSAQSGGGVFLDDVRASLSRTLLQGNTNSASYWGAGLRVDGGEITLDGNMFDGNQGGNGGGASIAYAQAWLGGNSFFDNTATRGAGLFLDQSTVVLDENLFQENSASDGGGLYVRWSNLTMTNNVLLENDAMQTGGMYGGGLWIDTSNSLSTLIRGNLFSGNQAADGGAISMIGNRPAALVDNLMMDNLASNPYFNGHGGGLYIDASQVTMDRNIIHRNQAIRGSNPYSEAYGGGMVITKDITLTNNLITDNQVSGLGDDVLAPGVYIHGASPVFYHNTIANNIGGDGSGVYVIAEEIDDTPSQPAFYNTIIAGQVTGVIVSAESDLNLATVDGILWWANTNNTQGKVLASNEHTGDPLFGYEISWDYHLTEGSAAIDQSPAAFVAVDIDGEPRLGTPDLGADEYWGPGSLTRLFLPLVVKE